MPLYKEEKTAAATTIFSPHRRLLSSSPSLTPLWSHYQVNLSSFSFFFFSFGHPPLFCSEQWRVSPLFTRPNQFWSRPKWWGRVWPIPINRKEVLLGRHQPNPYFRLVWANSFWPTLAQFILGQSHPRQDGLCQYNWAEPIPIYYNIILYINWKQKQKIPKIL